MKPGTLYLVPSLLSPENAGVIPAHTLEILFQLDHFIVENEKSARHFLKAVGFPKRMDDISMAVLDEHTRPEDLAPLLKHILSGKNTGLVSEAGCPAVADPGSDLVRLAHSKGIEVVPLTGPSSILLALMGSGMNGQGFCFSGYLPREKNERIKKIAALEQAALKTRQTQLFIEAPYRNQHVLEDLLKTCAPTTLLCLAVDLTSPNGWVKTKTVGEWKKMVPELSKLPVVFLLGIGN